MSYEFVTTDSRDGVGVITLNRPKALNALSAELMAEFADAVDNFEADDSVGCILVTGSEKAFAAGADIKQMRDKSFVEAYSSDFITKDWERVATSRKPVVAAVNGYALGGGCELAMMCDIIIASETAKFGQPEITIGIIPGAGGSQRLTRSVGKAKAMDLVLTGRMMDVEEAERAGLVSRIVASEDLLDEAMKVAVTIAGMSKASTMMAKESVNRAYETTLSEGVRFERRLFHSLFATDDQTEGMTAFIEKRSPVWKNS